MLQLLIVLVLLAGIQAFAPVGRMFRGSSHVSMAFDKLPASVKPGVVTGM